jgi:hypothetical protein
VGALPSSKKACSSAGSASRSPATDGSVNEDRAEGKGELTVLTEEEPVAKVALEVVERGIADKVAILAVLERAVGPAGAVEGVVLHGDDVHGGEMRELARRPRVFIHVCATEQVQTNKQAKSGDFMDNT